MESLTATVAESIPVKRRRRSAAERLQIVEETLVPGASVARIARSHGINANQVFAWRKLHLAGKLVEHKPAVAEAMTRLLPVTVSDTTPPQITSLAPSVISPESVESHRTASIHIQLPKAQLRVEGGADATLLRTILECLLR